MDVPFTEGAWFMQNLFGITLFLITLIVFVVIMMLFGVNIFAPFRRAIGLITHHNKRSDSTSPKKIGKDNTFNVPYRAITHKSAQQIELVIFGTIAFAFTWLLYSTFAEGVLAETVEAFGVPAIIHAMAFGIIASLVACYVPGFRINRKQYFVVIERLGFLYRIHFEGPYFLFLNGLIDKDIENDTLKIQKLELYAALPGEERPKMDFANASAPIKASVWGAIADTKVKGHQDDDHPLNVRGSESIDAILQTNPSKRNWWQRAILDILKWTYSVDNSYQIIYELVNGELRPLLQKRDIDTASKNLDRLSEELTNSTKINGKLHSIGFYLDPTKGITLQDIDLPPEVQAERLKKLQGQKDAERTKARNKSWKSSVLSLVKDKDLRISPENAMAFFNTQQGLKTIEEAAKTGGLDLSLVSRDMGDVTGQLELIRKQGKRGAS